MTAPHYLAPYFGVSLFAWTSLIAVTMGGLALGYRLGAELAATRPATPEALAAGGLALAALWTALVPAIADPLLARLAPLDVRLGSLLGAALLALPSMILLGALSPLLVARAGHARQGDLGGNAGRLYATSTWGSLFGTLVGGFLLVGNLDTRPALLSGALLLALAVVVWAPPVPRPLRASTARRRGGPTPTPAQTRRWPPPERHVAPKGP